MKINASNQIILVATIATFLIISCAKIGSVTLHKTYSDIAFTIPSPLPPGSVEIEEQIEADLQQVAKDNNFDISKIESANINSITINIIDSNATPVTFDIIDAATFSFYADGVNVAEVASDDATQTSPTQMDFDLKGIDVSPYLKSNLFKVRLKITTNDSVRHDVPMIGSIECSYKVKPFKK